MTEDVLTERLLLHPLSEDEAAAIVATGARGAGYPSAGDVEAARNLVDRCRTSGDPQPFGPYEVRLLLTGEPIGGVGFNRVPDDRGVTTIGYGLAESARGHGYATEALRALLHLAQSLGVGQVRGSADIDNPASCRVMEAAGMTLTHDDGNERFYATTWDRRANGPLGA